MPVTVCMYLDLRRAVLGSANDPNDCASMNPCRWSLRPPEAARVCLFFYLVKRLRFLSRLTGAP
jgi:hypothetical protein